MTTYLEFYNGETLLVSTFSGRGDLLVDWRRFPVPIYLHYLAVSPCCTEVLHVFLWRIQSLALQQWHQLGKPPARQYMFMYPIIICFIKRKPDKIHSKCILSCQCHIVWCVGFHQHEAQLQW